MLTGARCGDWLSVGGRMHNQKGQIEAVYSADGSPPYLMRWDDGREALLYWAGPETQLVPASAPAPRPHSERALGQFV